MALLPKFFRFPFGSTGDKTVVPDDVQPSGSVSYAEGWGYDYERNPATDPAAKRIPRNESNQLAFDTTANIQQYQLYGVPFFYGPENNGGTAISYARGSRVRYADGGVENVYISLVDNNTKLPTDTTAWLVETPLQFASSAEVIAAAVANKVVSPATIGPAVQSGSWNSATAGGTANALTVTLNPAPSAPPSLIVVKFTATNTGAATIKVNTLGPFDIVRLGGSALQYGDLPKDGTGILLYDGSRYQVLAVPVSSGGISTYASAGTYVFVVPQGITKIHRLRIWGAGGGGGGCSSATGMGGGAGSGAYGEQADISVMPGSTVIVTVGAGGTAGPVGNTGGTGGTSSFGTFLAVQGGTGAGGSQGGVAPIGTGAPAPSGAQIGVAGNNGTEGFVSGAAYQAGAGAGAPFGSGATPPRAGFTGRSGLFPGGGGGGCAGYVGIGGVGASGLVIVEY